MAHLNPQCSDSDQVFQKYLDRAIVDIHDLGDEIKPCGRCEEDLIDGRRVLGTGHPLADIMLIKWSPREEELNHGVAFYGRAGEAIRLSTERLSIDPLDLYGTNVLKCGSEFSACTREQAPNWLLREVQIVEPRILVVMGHETLAAVNDLGVPAAQQIAPEPGEIQAWTHTCEALWVPDIDASLERPQAKQTFWQAFKVLGDWYGEKPPF